MGTITAFLSKIAGTILAFLPDSPIRPFIDNLSVAPWIGYLNWFIPVGTFVAIGTAWLAAIAIFYTYQMILRWSKAVAD